MKQPRRINNTTYTVHGTALTLRQWARRINVNAHTLYRRFYRAKEVGISDADAACVAVMKEL